jgi:WD40 repeat protein
VGQVKVFKTRTAELVLTLDDEPGKLAAKNPPAKLNKLKRAMGSINSLGFSPDGRWLATCGGSFEEILGTADGDVQRTFETGMGPGKLKVWDVTTGKMKLSLPGEGRVRVVAYSPDGRLLATAEDHVNVLPGSSTGGVTVWDSETGAKVSTVPFPPIATGFSLAFSPDNTFLLVRSSRRDLETKAVISELSLIRARSGVIEWRRAIPGDAVPIGFLRDGKTIAALCNQRVMQFLEAESGKRKQEIRLDDSLAGGRWVDMAMPSSRNRIVIGGLDKSNQGFVEVWDVEDARAR